MLSPDCLLKQKAYSQDAVCTQIDAEGSDTVADLKSKIHEAHGHAVETQKLIFAGMDRLIAGSGN